MIRRAWFWLMGWRTGNPGSGGDWVYLVQHADSSIGTACWWPGGENWSCIGSVRYWKRLRGPMIALPEWVSYRAASS